MSNYRFTFEEVVKYAEYLGYQHRNEPSRAKDYTFTFWRTPQYDSVMVLYEGPKRLIRGHKEAEVCWICIHEDGSVSSIPSRYFRNYFTQLPGFGFNDEGKQKVCDVIRTINNKEVQ